MMDKKDRIPVVAVVGPTASGKSRLAVEIALNKNGEVISADSMQIYKGMDIGTAKPTEEEMCGVPHHLINFAELSRPFSVADYVSLASGCVSELSARGKLPVLAGGTGLYIRSLLQNIQFTENDKDEALRKELAQKAENQGVQALVEELRGFDPESAERIHPNNIGRMIRAIEIYRTTGITMTEQLNRSRQTPSPYDACVIGLDFKDRQKLYKRINLRVDSMMRAGLLAEAEEVLGRPGSQTALQAIGYKELLPYFRSECTLEDAVESIRRESRRYAKRQLTWFRRDGNIIWIMMDEYESFDEVVQQALRIVDQKGW
ncbi:tRNA (adenosine(37)-N6)-dimethylallyltransferase MiaA [Caproiciproducens sp.]|uniref:tRNA (adenosine(37)-N6)-dimethylallyltransferase MiaA n=1 Tax=Caproiciproducens sp. TaxID=1954376 RepID=UPI00289C0771|nr:tRNA (adenosine(37)-N6)-dimethylallyltransferase MiaA [Caproiciproducens sp.]